MEAKRRGMDLPEKVSIAALIGSAATLIVFGGVLSAILFLIVAFMGWTRAFERNAAAGKPTLSGRARLLIGASAALAASAFHPNISVPIHSKPDTGTAGMKAQAPVEAPQAAKASPMNPAEVKRKLAALVAGERELDRQDVEGRLIFWDQIVALAPDNVEFDRKRAEVKREADELAPFREHPELGADIVEVSNRLGGFGIISVINVKIRNRAVSNLKDFQISCDHMGASGTVISRTHRTLYEVVPARSTKAFRNVNMGVVNPQSRRFSCRIDGASVD